MKKKNANKQEGKTEVKEGDIFADLKNQLARVLADYDNLKKRSEEERSSMYKLASVSFMTKLLPIIDNLHEAQNHVNDSGIAIIIGQLETLAKDEGFEEMRIKVGDEFNPETSEAIEVVESDEKINNNKVSEVVLSGWKYSDGTVVRHARVKVFKGKEDSRVSEEVEETKEDQENG